MLAALTAAAVALPIAAQDADDSLAGLLTPNDATGTGGPATLFGTPSVRAETSARLSGWDPSAGIGYVSVTFTYPEGYHQIDNDDVFTLVPGTYPGIVFGSAVKGEPVFEDGLAEYFDETTVVLEFRADGSAVAGSILVEALFQICDEKGTCLFPDSETHAVFFDPDSGPVAVDAETRSVLDWAAGAEARAERDAESGPGAGTVGGGEAGPLWLFLLMALVGGILLNVMPCVLPLLSVKALGLIRQAGENRKAILTHSWLYVAGIVASFWALATVVIALQASGRLLGWGFQFQSPAFVLALIAVIWVFALSMFDVFVIEPPRRGVQGASAAGAKGGYLGSFLTGVFAVLVATPCTAPFLGPALGFAFSQPPAVILAVFTVTGMGLGLPFLLLGLWPGVVERLPRPGAWMNTFKEIMGFLLLGTAVYLFTTFLKLAPGGGAGALWWLLFLGLASWLLGKARRPVSAKAFRITGQLAAVGIAVASGFLLIELPRGGSPAPSAGVVEPASEDAIRFDEEDVLARIAADEPLFLEFTASWCTTCKVNQRVLKDRDVRSLMEEKGVAHVKGDLTAYDETLTRWLAEFGRAGVPLYVLYRPGEEPLVFPELLGKDGLIKELELIAGP